MLRTARFQLTALYAMSFFVLLILFGTFRMSMFQGYLDDQVDASVTAFTDVILSSAGERLDAGVPPPGSAAPDASPTELFYLVLDATSGQPVAGGAGGTDMSGFLGLAATQGAQRGEATWQTIRVNGEHYRVLASPVYRDGGVVETILTVRNMSGRDHAIRTNMNTFMAGAGGVLVVALVVGYYLAGKTLRPIVVAYDRQRAFVTGASHELNTPITIIRTASDLLLTEDLTEDQRLSVEEIRDVATEASQLVASLLELARLQARTTTGAGFADISEIAREECAAFAALLAEHNTDVTLELAPVTARVSAVEARLVVRVLLENVLMHTPPGTAARISTRVVGRSAQLIVEDDGPGVPPNALDSIAERFTKGNAARTGGIGEGYGLGLAIAHEIASRSFGSLRAAASPLGGLSIAVSFPQGQAPRA